MTRNLINSFKLIILVLPVLISIFLGSGCTRNNVNLSIYTEAGKQASIDLLPPELRSENLSFANLLQAYDLLNDKQKMAVLAHFLEQKNLSGQEKAEASYMLARLAQQAISSRSQLNLAKTADSAAQKAVSGAETLELFEQAQLFPPLRTKSLWHKSEVAAVIGKEKLVRQALSNLLTLAKDNQQVAAIQYALAQSYLRTNEIEKASALLNRIRHDFPGTDYALGAGYYLGSLYYSQFEQGLSRHTQEQIDRQNSQADLLKNVCVYYFEYLRASPSGHFAPDILLKLENLISHEFVLAKESELITMANAYSATGQYKSSLAYWQKAGTDKHWFAVSNCLIKLGKTDLAQEKFFRGLAKNPAKNQIDPQCLILATEINSHLNSRQCLRFWQTLQKLGHVRFPFQDDVLWNLAARSNFPQNLSYYQDLLLHYPDSAHASEAQWRLLWHKLKSSKTIFLPAIAEMFHKAANTYKHHSLAPRFLFWEGKIREGLREKEKAVFCYQQTARLYPYGYYGQRAKARLNFITNATADNYFQAKYVSSGKLMPTAQNWDWPTPEKAIAEVKQKDMPILYELIHLKQYDEALAESKDMSEELSAWLEGKTKQPWLSINTASRCLEESTCHICDRSLLWQYSFPLLYHHKIIYYCNNANGIDPFLIQALIREESRYNANAVSQAQAIGLCQLMPSTAYGIGKSIGIKIIKKEQLFKPDSNLALGTYYLSLCLRTFHNDALLAIASYNAGTNAVKNCLARRQDILTDPDQFVEDFPFAETRNYIRKVFASYWHYKQLYQPE